MGMLPREGESSQAASNNEWIELYNPTDQEINLTGWKITSSDGSPNIILSGSIKSQSYFLLERGNDDVLPNFKADQIYSFTNNALSNSGEHLFLKDAASSTVDEINASSGWLAGDNTTKETMQKSGSNWVTALATPKSGWVNAITNSENSSTSQTASTQSTISQSSTIYPSIKASAGEDKITIAGSEVDFVGQAWNSNKEPLEDTRFWWNFGDGESKEGKSISHIFQIPGRYTVGLHISNGSYAASDYAYIEVIANKLKIIDVLLGEKGYFKLYNPSDFLLDIGGWLVESGSGKQFVIPTKTKIGPMAEIALANSLTKIFLEEKTLEAKMRYPNGLLALEWKTNNTPVQHPAGTIIQTPAIYNQTPKISKIIRDESLPEAYLTRVVSTTSEIAEINKTTPGKLKISPFWLAGILSLITAVGYILVSKWKNQKL